MAVFAIYQQTLFQGILNDYLATTSKSLFVISVVINSNMLTDPNNKIVQLCAKGIELEATQAEAAKDLFMQAWNDASNDLEKCIAAHYVARHQMSTKDKLHWDKISLEFALKIDDSNIKLYCPSLYLNIAKCYEDLEDYKNAQNYYQGAFSYENVLPDDGYGKMIRLGIANGMERVSKLLLL